MEIMKYPSSETKGYGFRIKPTTTEESRYLIFVFMYMKFCMKFGFSLIQAPDGNVVIDGEFDSLQEADQCLLYFLRDVKNLYLRWSSYEIPEISPKWKIQASLEDILEIEDATLKQEFTKSLLND